MHNVKMFVIESEGQIDAEQHPQQAWWHSVANIAIEKQNKIHYIYLC